MYSKNKYQRSGLLRCFMAIVLVALGMQIQTKANQLPAGNKSESVIGIDVTNIWLDGPDIRVDLALDLTKVSMKPNVETVYTPMFVNGTDTVRMSSFAVLGRNRMYWDKRNNALLPISFYKQELVDGALTSVSPDAVVNAADSKQKGNYVINFSTRYQPWMEVAEFTIDTQNLGCANCIKDIEGMEPYYPLAQTDFVQRSFFPEFLYVTPVAEAVKMREISARAYIDFPVNRTEIYPDYRRNPQELSKIRGTIDSVKNDKDINITSLHISGTASPEGSYQNNVRLAKGRTEALKDYVQGLYRFPAGFITTSYEPVDWKGLAEFLEMVVNLGYRSQNAQNNTSPQYPSDSIRFDQFQNINFDPATINGILPNAGNILAIADSDIEPFNRNQKIKQTYPDQYAWLLENVYPALRHSDYRIEFEIKTFTEVSEILEVMAESPQKLSLAELFVAANSQEPGSALYNRAFELAVTMYPDDETANLNAATAAMQRGDMINAERFMSKVTQETPEADYAKAMYTLLQGNTEEAVRMFNSLANSLNPEVAAKATQAKEGLEEVARANARTFVPIQ